MLSGRISHVAFEAEHRPGRVHRSCHEAISHGLRDHGGCSHRGRCRIAVDDRPVLWRRLGKPESVDDARVGAGIDRREALGQQPQIGAVKAIPIDRRRTGRHHDDLPSVTEDCCRELLAPRRRDAFGVVEPLQVASRPPVDRLEVECDGGGDEGSGETSASGFIGSRDDADTQGPVEPEERRGARPPSTRGRRARRRHAFATAASRARAPSCQPCRAGSTAWPDGRRPR